MRRQPRIGRAALFALCVWSWGCRTYQPIAPAEVPAKTTVVVTFQAVRDWMVPGSEGAPAKAVRSKLLVARLIRVAGDTVVVAPLRLEDQRGRVVGFPAEAPQMAFTPADGAYISAPRYSRGRTGLLVVGLAVALWAAVMASSCIMCGFGDGDVVF